MKYNEEYVNNKKYYYWTWHCPTSGNPTRKTRIEASLIDSMTDKKQAELIDKLHKFEYNNWVGHDYYKDIF